LKIFLRVLFIIGFVFLSVNLVRLTYQLWLEPTSSVLDAYDDEVDAGIKGASSLEDLVTRYDQAHNEVTAYENDPDNEQLEPYERANIEPYATEIKLERAIESWEKRSKQISELRVYWMLGLVFLVLGIFAQRYLNELVGTAAVLVAFSEMIYWTSPAYLSGRSLEFERLLANKMFFAAVTFALLLATAYLTGVLAKKKGA